MIDKILRSFSLKRNLKRLFSDSRYTEEEKEFEIFNAFKVFSICLIVMGNTYFNALMGPIQNLEIVTKLFSSFEFLFVFQADLQCDVFFWITGFTMSFMWLKKIHANSGFWWTHPVRIFFDRVFRLLPLYAFMIFFLW